MEAINNLISPELISILDAIGLPVIAAALVIFYRSLVKRTSFLQNSMIDMKKVYDSIIETSQKRSSELEASMENQKVFNELYLKMVSDSSQHAEKINEWRKSEVFILENRIDSLHLELKKSVMEIDAHKKDKKLLKDEISKLKEIISQLKITRMGPGESMASSHK